MRPRQLALYKTVVSEPAKQIWQRIAEEEREAVARIYARVVVRAAKRRCEGRDRNKRGDA